MKKKTQDKHLSAPSTKKGILNLQEYEKKFPGRLRGMLEGKIKPDLEARLAAIKPDPAQPSKSQQSESVEEAPSKNYINAYHEEESLRLKKEFSEKQPMSLEEFVKGSKIANRSREQQTSS